MQGNTHRFGGIALGAGVSLIAMPIIHVSNPVIFTATMMAGGAIGSLIPDIDHEGSLIGRKIKPVAQAVRKVCGHRGYTHTLLALFIYGLITLMFSSMIMGTIGIDMSFGNRILFSIISATVIGTAIAFILNRLPKFLTRKQLGRTIIGVFAISFILSMVFPRFIISYIPVYMVGSTIGYASHLLLDMLTVSGVPLFKPFTNKMFRIAKLRTGAVEKQVSAVCVLLTFICLIFMII